MNHAHLAVGAVVLQAFSQDALVLPHQGVPALVGEGGGGGRGRLVAGGDGGGSVRVHRQGGGELLRTQGEGLTVGQLGPPADPPLTSLPEPLPSLRMDPWRW